MGRYFFHARLGKHLVPDDVGVELPDLSRVKHIILEAMLESSLDLSQAWTFEIVDENGEIVMRVPISDLPTKQ